MNYFIFLTNDVDSRRLAKPSALEVAKYRLGRREWGLARMTRHRTELRVGDKVLVYLTGHRDFSQHFVAKCTIGGSVKQIPSSLSKLVDAPDRQGVSMPVYSVALADTQFLSNPVSIRDHLTKLNFIKQPESKKWGAYLQGGVIKITRDDYRLISERGNRRAKSSSCTTKLSSDR